MINVYGGDTPNVFKVLIALEELGMAYDRIPVDVMKGEQFTPAFLAISPNNRVPAIVDDAPAGGGEPLPIFESGAILLYLAEKGGALLPTDPRSRYDVIQWVMWQMAGQGPMLGQAGHFLRYAPEKIAYGIERYTKEAARLYRVLNTRLDRRQYLSGEYSVADIACWPWLIFRDFHGIRLEDYPEVERWFREIEGRPAVQRALGDFVLPTDVVLGDEARAILFGQKGQ